MGFSRVTDSISTREPGEGGLVRTPTSRKWFLAILSILAATMVVLAPQVFLLFFCCVLVGVFLAALCRAVEKYFPVSRTWSLTIVVVLLLAICAALAWFTGPQLAKEFSRLGQQLPRAFAHLEGQIASTQLGQSFLKSIPDLTGLISYPGAFSKASTFFSSTVGVLLYLVVMAFVGLYLAADPAVYVEAFARLFPHSKRPRIRTFLYDCGITLRHWLVGRFFLMASNGVVTAIGLWLMNMPLAVPLGIISAILNFVPNIGPILATIPALLIALLISPGKALAVGIFYFIYQMFDGYVLTPLVQRRTVSIAPAVTIMAQVLFGVLFGTLGVLVAVPLAAVGLVFFREVYQPDIINNSH